MAVVNAAASGPDGTAVATTSPVPATDARRSRQADRAVEQVAGTQRDAPRAGG